MSKDHSAAFEFVRHIQVNGGSFVFQEEIYASYDSPPPKFSWEIGESEFHLMLFPRTTIDKVLGVYKVGTFTADLRRISVKNFPQVIDEKGDHFYKVGYSIKSSIVNDLLKFELIFDGRNYGETQLEFD